MRPPGSRTRAFHRGLAARAQPGGAEVHRATDRGLRRPKLMALSAPKSSTSSSLLAAVWPGRTCARPCGGPPARGARGHIEGTELPAPFCRLIERLLAHLKELDRQAREHPTSMKRHYKALPRLPAWRRAL